MCIVNEDGARNGLASTFSIRSYVASGSLRCHDPMAERRNDCRVRRASAK